jgi:WhiB family transcriptional regulator, redox-sensing transcriptional regulator
MTETLCGTLVAAECSIALETGSYPASTSDVIVPEGPMSSRGLRTAIESSPEPVDALAGDLGGSVADLLGNAPEWQERALCAQTDPEAFFPEKGGSTREAKRICSRCEVRAECLEYALSHNERFGIWGGLSERERRKLKRRVS